VDPAPPTRLVRRIGVAVVALACLLSPYTMLLRVVLLELAALVTSMPQLFPGTAARNCRQFPCLDGPVTYGADADGVWVRTPDFSAKAAWRHVTSWRERNAPGAPGVPTLAVFESAG
jgi:hypothetical protein